MSSVTFKCPNCGSGLSFNPERHSFSCEYCRSDFKEADLQPPTMPEKTGQDDEFFKQARIYNCPSCGGEIIGDETTAATLCVYCHNPVILSGRLTGQMKPDKVIPFAFDKKEASNYFKKWTKSRWFIDNNFLNHAVLDNLQGVYFPFWVVDGEAYGHMRATCRNMRIWRSGNVEYTETSTYEVYREGRIEFNNLVVKALNKDSLEMITGIYPYRTAEMRDFSMPFLSGFIAEIKNLEKDDVKSEADGMLNQAGSATLRSTISGYGSVMVNSASVAAERDKWRYALLPAWLMTYKYRGENYFFSMNGQTGQVTGRVPVSRMKLTIFFIMTSAAATLVLSRFL